MKNRLLIVDDDEDIRTQLKWALVEDYDIFTAEDRAGALASLGQDLPGVVLLDLGLPPSPGTPDEGFAILGEIGRRESSVKVIITSGQSDRENALRAIDEGAYDFLSKPVDVDELRLVVKRAFYLREVERELAEAKSCAEDDGFEGMLGTSPEMQSVFAAIRKVARTQVPVLILGESGTGKEMVARAIHRQSERRDTPFVAINCGAIPADLLESELFGYEKGAFTGAQSARAGRCEAANGGTLFLDEVGELPGSLQVKLLRFLQERRITRLGSNKEIALDVRVVAATNADLNEAKRNGNFREDLYYRLAVVVIRLPALRERKGDAALVAKQMVERFAKELDSRASSMTAAALRAVDRYSWPGNVRELENRLRRAVIMAEGHKITPDDLELNRAELVEERFPTLKEAREDLERRLAQAAIDRASGKLNRAAEFLGISRPALYDLLNKLGMRQS